MFACLHSTPLIVGHIKVLLSGHSTKQKHKNSTACLFLSNQDGAVYTVWYVYVKSSKDMGVFLPKLAAIRSSWSITGTTTWRLTCVPSAWYFTVLTSFLLMMIVPFNRMQPISFAPHACNLLQTSIHHLTHLFHLFWEGLTVDIVFPQEFILVSSRSSLHGHSALLPQGVFKLRATQRQQCPGLRQ